MRITLLALGSRGDVEPYLALGVALQQVGHQAQVVTFETFAPQVEALGLTLSPVAGDIAQVAANESQAMQADNPLKVLLSFQRLRQYVFELQGRLFEASQNADILVYHPGMAAGYFIATHLKIPSVLATPFPMTPTRAYPSLIFYPGPRLGAAYNHLTHRLFEGIMWSASSAPVKAFWQRTLGRAPADLAAPYGRQQTRTRPTVVGCSDHVFPRPADWPAHVHNTGYWFVEAPAGWTPPADLARFLEAGPPPVYVGFGSVGNPAQAQATTRLVVEALQRAGQRGVLAAGWGALNQGAALPKEIMAIEAAPHSWLFPRMAAVVHHGGAGTTAAGLRAGRPSVLIPHANDQFAWGRRVQELGVGSAPIPRRQLTAARLAAGLEAALQAPVAAAAAALGEKIRAEAGAATAARIILDTVN